MTERGFYHPVRGYWQTVSDPAPGLLATYPEGTVEVPLKPGAGYEWNGSAWVAPAPLSPAAKRAAMPMLTARQIRLGLLQNGVTGAQVESALAAIPDQTERETALIEWEYATQFYRTHPLIDAMAAAFSWTPEQVDTLWVAAAAL